MSWNYRVLRRVYDTAGEKEVEYSIHEVYYDDDGRPTTCTQEAVCPMGSTPEELQEDVKRYVAAMEQPILNWHAFGDEESK